MSDYQDKNDGRRTTAYILLGVAAYILLSNTGLLDFIGIGSLLRWLFSTLWDLIPLAILLFGIYWLSRAESEEKPLAAWFVVLLGSVLLVSQLGLFGLDFGDLFLPLWLVVIAIVIMNPRDLLPRNLNTRQGEQEDKIKLVAFMGGGELNYSSQYLQGGEIICFWGGYELDFTDADMEGDEMELNLICIMGGVEIKVPPNWVVDKQGAVCIMGGFSNKTRVMTDDLDLPEKTLKINGLALMGGGEIKN